MTLKAFWETMCQTLEQNKTFENIKKVKSTDRWQESLSDTRESRLKLFFVFIFPVGFLLHDSFCFQLSLLGGKQRKGKISGEVSFYTTLLSKKKKWESSKRRGQIYGKDELQKGRGGEEKCEGMR